MSKKKASQRIRMERKRPENWRINNETIKVKGSTNMDDPMLGGKQTREKGTGGVSEQRIEEAAQAAWLSVLPGEPASASQ